MPRHRGCRSEPKECDPSPQGAYILALGTYKALDVRKKAVDGRGRRKGKNRRYEDGVVIFGPPSTLELGTIHS